MDQKSRLHDKPFLSNGGLIHRLTRRERNMLLIYNVGPVVGTHTGDSPPIGDFIPVVSFDLPLQLWAFTNFFDLGHFPYTNV